MGFNVLLDIAGSMVIGAIVILMIGRVNTNIAENTVKMNSDFRNQVTLTSGIQVLENDLRKIGMSVRYLDGYDDVSKSILQADSIKLKYLCDYDRNATLDTIYYYLDTTNIASTNNPKDHYIYKRVNSGTPAKIIDGVVHLNFQYYDRKDSLLPTPVAYRDSIRSVLVNITLEPADSIKGLAKGEDPLPSITWKSKITARNLIKR